MQPNNRKEKIEKIYKEFREIYWDESNDSVNKENYPEWFQFCDDHNKQFGNDGYLSGKLGHELKHYAILQTPIYEEGDIVIVGNNNSWFIPNKYKMNESLRIVKDLEKGVPEENFLTRNESDYSRDMRSYFGIIGEKSEKLFERAIGINRLWIQTGGKCPPSECKLTEEMRFNLKLKREWKNLEKKCSEWTMEIIEIINPKLLLLVSGPAQKLYAEGIHRNGFWVQHCPAPSFKRFRQKLKPDYIEFESLKELEEFKAKKIKNGIEKAGLLND